MPRAPLSIAKQMYKPQVYTCKTCHKSTCIPGIPYIRQEHTGDKRHVKRDGNNPQNALKKQQHVEKGGEVIYIGNDTHGDREGTEKMKQIPSSSLAKNGQDLHTHPIHTAVPTLLDQLERKKKKTLYHAKKRLRNPRDSL